MIPSWFELSVLWLAGLCFGAAFWLGWRSMRAQPLHDEPVEGSPERVCGLVPAARTGFIVGFILAIGLALWRVATAGSSAAETVPFSNFFDSFLLLGLILAALGIYFHLTRHLRSLTFFLLPMIGAVFLMGGALSLLYPRPFDYKSTLNMAHVITVFVGSACFAAACVGGCVYLLADYQLRRKRHWFRLPSLASVEKFTRHIGFLGFPVLTIAMITGAIKAHQVHASVHTPKIALAVAAWVVYAVLFHIPLAPSFRGRREAWISIVGFVLLLSVFFAVR